MLKTTRFDITGYLKTEADIQRYLEGVFAENDPDFIPVALGDAARARNKMAVAAECGGKPAFAAVARAINALGYRLSIVPIGQ